jgi:hypothetical protein
MAMLQLLERASDAGAEQPDDGPNANQSKFYNMPLTAYAGTSPFKEPP